MSTSIEKSAVLAVRVWGGWTDLTACCCWTELSCFLPLFITTQSLTLFLLQWLRCSLCPSLAKFTKRTDFCQVSELVGLMITRASSGYGVRTSWKGQQDVVLNGSEPLDETGCALALLLLLRKGEGCVQYPLQPEGTPAWVFCLPRNNFAFLPPPGCLGPCVQAWLSRAPSGPFVSSSFLQSGTTSAKPVERAHTQLTHPLMGRGRNVVHIFHFLRKLLSYIEGTDVLKEGNGTCLNSGWAKASTFKCLRSGLSQTLVTPCLALQGRYSASCFWGEKGTCVM